MRAFNGHKIRQNEIFVKGFTDNNQNDNLQSRHCGAFCQIYDFF